MVTALGFCTFFMLTILKVLEVINLSWWIVILPLFAGLFYFIFIFLIVFLFGTSIILIKSLKDFINKKKENKND